MNNERRQADLAFAWCCSLFIVAPRCEAQNLVPNPSFELNDTCPYTIGFQLGDRPLHWYSWLNSPEYFHACAGDLQSIDTLVDVPQNGWTYQYAWEGDAYIGFYAFDNVAGDEYREYVGAELLQPLQVGCTYQLRFRTNPANNGNYWLIGQGSTACDNVGMLFTTSSNAWFNTTGPDFPYRNFAHLRTMSPVADTSAWTVVEGTFVADSAYTHVVLGNFFPDSLTSAFPIGNPDPWNGITFYLIDGVEVIPLDAGCNGLGIPDPVSAEAPNISWIGAIVVQWENHVFDVEILDAVGRIILKASSSGGYLQMPPPRTAGSYCIRVRSKEKQHVAKFIVW